MCIRDRVSTQSTGEGVASQCRVRSPSKESRPSRKPPSSSALAGTRNRLSCTRRALTGSLWATEVRAITRWFGVVCRRKGPHRQASTPEEALRVHGTRRERTSWPSCLSFSQVKHKIGRNIAGASLVYQNQPEQCQWRTLPEVPDTAEFRSASIEPPELHQEGAHAHVPHTRTQPLPNARQDTRLETLLAQTESFFKSLGKDQPQREEQPSEVHVPEVSVGEESVGEDTDRCPLCLENLYQNDEAVHRCLCGCRICLWCFEHQMSKGPEGKCPCCGCVVATELQGTEHDLDVIDERDLEDRGEESDASWDLMAEEVAEFEALSLL
eukprot:TRINITY_DN3096_c0_g1_i2.p1 TRINITY_DN3096_c0_g1~~TRINITY_DN3096_c0_g1_i2.p1  ORF type:complete len:325 (-),score=34.15 TRINITY_DN3096_c0_g1_i2:203-1177(-)